jgi:hypothetical protein
MATIVPDIKNRMLFFLVVLLIAAFVPALPTEAQTLLRVATPGALTGALPIYLGAKKGVFSKYGLTVEVIVNVLRTMSYEDPAFLSIPPYKFFDLSLIQELKAELR